jgi:hypothetical protein
MVRTPLDAPHSPTARQRCQESAIRPPLPREQRAGHGEGGQDQPRAQDSRDHHGCHHYSLRDDQSKGHAWPARGGQSCPVCAQRAP